MYLKKELIQKVNSINKINWQNTNFDQLDPIYRDTIDVIRNLYLSRELYAVDSSKALDSICV